MIPITLLQQMKGSDNEASKKAIATSHSKMQTKIHLQKLEMLLEKPKTIFHYKTF